MRICLQLTGFIEQTAKRSGSKVSIIQYTPPFTAHKNGARKTGRRRI